MTKNGKVFSIWFHLRKNPHHCHSSFQDVTKLRISFEIKSPLQIANFKLEGFKPFTTFCNLVAIFACSF